MLPSVSTHLPSRDVEQMTWVVGGVSDASGKPTSFLDSVALTVPADMRAR